MQRDGKAVPFRRRIDWPVAPAAGKRVAHHQHQHLDEAGVTGEPFDLGHGEIRVLHREQDRAAQPRVAVEQFRRGPVVDRRSERRRHVLVEERDRPMQHVADGEAGAEGIERLALQRRKLLPGGPLSGRQSGRQFAGTLGG